VKPLREEQRNNHTEYKDTVDIRTRQVNAQQVYVEPATGRGDGLSTNLGAGGVGDGVKNFL
jgi:hypothetical protein